MRSEAVPAHGLANSWHSALRDQKSGKFEMSFAGADWRAQGSMVGNMKLLEVIELTAYIFLSGETGSRESVPRGECWLHNPSRSLARLREAKGTRR